MTSKRNFGPQKNKGKGQKRDGPSSSDAEVDAAEQQRFVAKEEAPKTQARSEPVDPKLNQPFSMGDVKKIQSTPDHKAPNPEDTIPGRYASVLFSTASHQGVLYEVYEDLKFLQEVYQNSESFRQFTQNSGATLTDVKQIIQSLNQMGSFQPATFKFMEVLAENKRLVFLKDVCANYQKLYQQFNREEKITIISAQKLTNEQERQVHDALKANPQNAGKEFVIDYKVDASIVGGLQMYTQSEFMDMSLSSRLDRLQSEVQKIID